MKIFGLNIERARNGLTEADTCDNEEARLLEWLGIDKDQPRKAINEITYYTCLKLLSETIGKLPLKYYQQTDDGRVRADPTEATLKLTMRPNDYMTPTTFWTTVEYNCQEYGNAYVWIRRIKTSDKYGGSYKIIDMWPMQSSNVQVMIDDAGVFGTRGKLWYKYTDKRTSKDYMFKSDDVLHIKTWFSPDGILGRSVRDILKYSVDGALEAQTYVDNLYKNGLTASMILQYTGEMNEAHRQALKKKFSAALSGSKNAGKIVPVPLGLTLTPVKMSLADAQFSDLKKYTALQIAGAFGVKPDQINSYDKSSYASSEAQQLAFLVDTVSYRLKMYEEEINAKILSPFEQRKSFFYKFNEKALLRTNTETQMQALTKAVNNGIYTPNEAREYLDLPAAEGGDVLIVNGNYIPITEVGRQYGEKGGS